MCCPICQPKSSLYRTLYTTPLKALHGVMSKEGKINFLCHAYHNFNLHMTLQAGYMESQLYILIRAFVNATICIAGLIFLAEGQIQTVL